MAGLGDETALALVGLRRIVIGVSATARFRGSPAYDVLAPIALSMPDMDGRVTVEEARVHDRDGTGASLRVSGLFVAAPRLAQSERLGFLLWNAFLRHHLEALAANEATQTRAKVLLVTQSYEEARAVRDGLSRAVAGISDADQHIRYLVQMLPAYEDQQALLASELDRFPETGADILIAPLSVVARGHNILQPGTSISAIASIFVLVRPVPPIDDAARALAYVSYDALQNSSPSEKPGDVISIARRRAENRLRYLQSHVGSFSSIPAELRYHALCDVLADLEQLTGRARRGGTDVRVYLVDGAFHEGGVTWRQLLSDAFERWQEEGLLDEMLTLHRSFLSALRRFADQVS